jgi:hypothetical protein
MSNFNITNQDYVVVDGGRTAVCGEILDIQVTMRCVGYHDHCDKPIVSVHTYKSGEVVEVHKNTPWGK